MGRLQPAVRHLRYQLTHNGTDDSHFIDLGRDLSAINRRSYRQGKVYHVAGITVHDSSSRCWVKVAVAPDTWMTRNAWYKGFKMWTAMNDQVLGKPVSVSMAPKWHDFKVYMHAEHRVHHLAGTDVSAPVDLQLNAVQRGTWDYSKFFIPAEGGSATSTSGEADGDHDEAGIHLLGPNSGTLGAFASVGLIAGYEDSRAKVQPAPSLSAAIEGSWVNALFDMGDTFDDIAEELDDANFSPPYAIDDMVGGSDKGATQNMIAPIMVGQTNTVATQPIGRIGPFSAICGLIEVMTSLSGSDPNTVGLTVELMPGKYKGVAASAIRQ